MSTFDSVLVVYAAVMFILSTAHIALALQALFMGLVYERDTTPGGPTIFYRENVFPNRKAIYIVNVGHLLLLIIEGTLFKKF